MYDLNYTQDEMFTRFLANTPAGEDAWRVIAAGCDGVAAVFNHQAAGTLAQLRRAGYSVGKAKPSKVNIDDILAELGA